MNPYEELKLNYKKRSSFVNRLTTAIATAMIAFIILPIGGFYTPKSDYTSTILFNENVGILSLENKQTQIQIDESNFDKERKQKFQLASFSITKLNTEEQSQDPFVYRPIYMAAGQQFNVPWQLIEAVHQVETGKSGSTAKTSSAGATGPMQFMPGTFRAYAIDGNQDGVTDITDITDSIYTAAHYLAKSGADEGRYDDALFNYNHSQSYVNTVKTIAQEIGL